MTLAMSKFDPWGPIASTLYSIEDSDLVQTVIGLTGVLVDWPVPDERTGFSNKTRIRAFRPRIDRAYKAIASDEDRSRFAQIVAKGILSSDVKEETKRHLVDRLNDIGWTIGPDRVLATQDVLLSEQFFPAGTHYDAYVAICDLLSNAKTEILIVDGYLGSSIFPTLRALDGRSLMVHALTSAKNLKADFHVEAGAFRNQFPQIQFEVRSTPDFHDRFVRIDRTSYYHVGASIKNAGSRAFLISRLQDPPVIAFLETYLEEAWSSAVPVP